jgi:hypothetical protein
VKVVDVKTTPDVVLSPPRPVSRGPSVIAVTGFDVSKDGRRLLMVREVKRDEASGPGLAVVQNWIAAFRKR